MEFTKWWYESGTPIHPPANAEVFLTDDATAFCLYRCGNFQVELYLIHPSPKLDAHEHPGVEVIQVQTNSDYGLASPILRKGKSHGATTSKQALGTGAALLTFEHWLDADPSTAAAAWKGQTVGPKHDALIRRFYPDAFVENGYADITKPSNYRELLAKGQA